MIERSKHWYWPVTLVLTIGYGIGGIVPVLMHYYGVPDERWLPEAFKPILCSFLLGLLGANVQLSIHFSRDINALSGANGGTLPSCFEFFGYVLKQVWGGIAAVFFVLAVKLGFLAAVTGTVSEIRLPAIVVISFCAGLRAFKILQALAGIVPSSQGKAN
jgi:hypothetical protein